VKGTPLKEQTALIKRISELKLINNIDKAELKRWALLLINLGGKK